MATFSNTQKTAGTGSQYKLLVGSGFYLTVGDGYELLITPAANSWSNASKNTATYTNVTKS